MALRVAYLCMESVFSVRPLTALLEAGHDVRFVLRPLGPVETRRKSILRRHRGFDVAWRRMLGMSDEASRTNPLHVAADHDIPAYLVGNASTPEVQALVEKERVDVIVVAFFNQLLRPALFERAPLGAVNLHPSLLPRYRGPAPLFWTYRDGVTDGGLTIHRIAPGEDDGDTLALLPHEIPLGTPGEDLVDGLAELAATHLPRTLDAYASGALHAVAQDPARVTRAPRAAPADLVVDASLGARRAFHFARGVGRWNPLMAHVGGTSLRVLDADGYDPDRRMPGECALIGNTLHLGADDGVVALQVRPVSSST